MNNNPFNIQAISFDANHWNITNIKEYLQHKNLKPLNRIHKVKNKYNVTLINTDNINSYKTIKLANNMDLTIEIPKSGGDIGDSINTILDSPLVKIFTTILPFL